MLHAGGTFGRLRRFSYGVRLRLLHVDILLADLDGSTKQRVGILLAVFNGIRERDPARAVQVLRILRIHQRRVMLTNHVSQVLRSVYPVSLHLNSLGVLLAIRLAAERGHPACGRTQPCRSSSGAARRTAPWLSWGWLGSACGCRGGTWSGTCTARSGSRCRPCAAAGLSGRRSPGGLWFGVSWVGAPCNRSIHRGLHVEYDSTDIPSEHYHAIERVLSYKVTNLNRSPGHMPG